MDGTHGSGGVLKTSYDFMTLLTFAGCDARTSRTERGLARNPDGDGEGGSGGDGGTALLLIAYGHSVLS